jgi:hypothetical protein
MGLTVRKSNLKPYILETAGALFARKGYGNVGMNEILKAGEIAPLDSLGVTIGLPGG